MYQPARRAFCALVLALVAGLAGLSLPASAHAQLPYSGLIFNQSRYAAIVVDANTGEVLYSRNADAARYPASITKLMTLYLVFEQVQSGRLSLNEQITVSSHAAGMSPTKLGLRAGETISVDSAIRAVAVKSANDMAAALAERVGGSESRFATLMTLRAQELGMSNTRFANASGLPDRRQLSSARDIAILSRALMRDFPQYYSYFGQRQFVWRGKRLNNHNHLLDSMPGVDGLKTGYINASGFNLAASAQRNGRRLIAVVMGGSSVATRDTHVEDLLETGFTVMARRDRGEVIQVAQNLFEAAPTGPITRPLSAQGDDDQRGLQIVVDRDLPSAESPYAASAYRNVPRSTPRVTQIPAPRGMQIATATVREAKRAPPREIKPAKPMKPVKVADVVLCDDEPAAVKPAKGKAKSAKAAKAERTAAQKKKPAAGKDKKARAAKAKGCDADRSIQVADKDSPKKKKKGGRDTDVERAVARNDQDATWIVQVGAFKDRAAAKVQLAKVGKAFPRQLADARGSVHGAVNGMFRARFSGLTKTAAHTACSSIKAKGMSCLAVNAG